MQIRLQAVHWKCGAGISLKQFLQHLRSVAPPPLFSAQMGTDFKGKRRLLYAEEIETNKWGVLVVTVKSAKAFLKVCPDAKGGLSFVLHQLDESKERIADFNFLLINTRTGRSAYAHYHQSFSFDDFTHFCRDEYRELKEKLIKVGLSTLGPQKKKKDEKSVNRKFKGVLSGDPLITKGDVAKLVKQLAKIDSLELTFTEISINQEFARPLQNVATLEKRIYRLDKTLPHAKIVAAVKDAIQRSKAEKGRVVGSSDNNLTRIVNLQKNLGVFSELDFKQTVAEETFDVGNLKGSPTLRAMLAVVSDPDYEGMFVIPERSRKDEVGGDD